MNQNKNAEACNRFSIESKTHFTGGEIKASFESDYNSERESVQSFHCRMMKRNEIAPKQRLAPDLTGGAVDPASLATDRIFDEMISMLENKTVVKNDVPIPWVFHPQTVQSMVNHGVTQPQIRDRERVVLHDAGQLKGFELRQDVPNALWSEMRSRNMENLIFANRIVPVPGLLLNALICAELAARFSWSDLKSCRIFVRSWTSGTKGERSEMIRIDIDPRHARRGFFLPVMRGGWIVGLQVYRYPSDNHPFLLRSRS